MPWLATDGSHRSEYDPSVAAAILGEAAYLLRSIGFAAEHAVLIGGLVPTLLVLDPGPGRPRHVGTGDLDVCLSLALIEGDTAEYERIEQGLRNAGYEATEDSYRWRRAAGLGLEVEFFCPAGPGRPAGRLFRPKRSHSPRAKQNMGSSLSAIALDAGNAIVDDSVIVERDVVLPGGERVLFAFRVTGLVGFLVAKVSALTKRDKPKDAYDIVWLLENWRDGPTGAARVVRESRHLNRPDVQAALHSLVVEFGTIDRVGPQSYARFMSDLSPSDDDRLRLARQAVGAVREFRLNLGDASRGLG
jgi:hypothetical protein